MSAITKHIFCNKDKIPVYKDSERSVIQGFLSKGDWMGLLKELPGKIKVITTNYVGWVNSEDCIEHQAQVEDFHFQYRDGEIRYFLSF